MSKRIDDLIAQGRRLEDQGNYQKAIPRFEEAVVLAHRDGDEQNEFLALHRLCVCWHNSSNYQKSVDAATRLLARARMAQDKHYEVIAILGIACPLSSLSLREYWPELKLLLHEGLTLARNLREDRYECDFLFRLGYWATLVSEYEEGFKYLQEALNTVKPDMEAQQFYYYLIYSALSELMRKRKQYREAVRYAEMAIGAAQKNGNPDYIADTNLALAYVEFARGECAEALRLIAQILPQAHEYGWKRPEQEALYLRGEVERELGHPQEAEAAARQALALAQEMKKREEEVKSLLSLGKALIALKRRKEARDILTQARRLSQERNYDDHFHEAEQLLQGAVWGNCALCGLYRVSYLYE